MVSVPQGPRLKGRQIFEHKLWLFKSLINTKQGQLGEQRGKCFLEISGRAS